MAQHLKSKCCSAETRSLLKVVYICMGCQKETEQLDFCDFCGTSGTCPDCGPSIVDFPEDG